MPAYCLCLTQKNTTPHVQWTLKQSEEISSMWKKKKKIEAPYRLCFHSVPIYPLLLFSSAFSAGFDSERNSPCGFAQQHLTISWNWHRLQCYRDSVVPDVQYRRAIHTEQSDGKERQPPLCSVCWCQYRGRSFYNWADFSLGTTTPSFDWFVAPAQGSNLMCLS